MEILKQLYGGESPYKSGRITDIRRAFTQGFNRQAEDVFSASGRIEILGNHTDHNNGCVLVGAISQDILAAAAKRDDGEIVIKSQGFNDITITSCDVQKRDAEIGTSAALVRGVLRALTDMGHSVGGFDAALTSDIFKGAGVSSSAAFEVLICKILSVYYLKDSLLPLEIAKAAQFAESSYFGKPCGLLDQSGIAFGGVNFIDFADTNNPEVRTLTPDFAGYSAVITNSGGDHSSLTPFYAEIKDDMHDISGYFDKKVLREVPYSTFLNHLPQLNKKYGGRAVLRAMHFYEENTRVGLAAKALAAGDMQLFLDNVNASGESSYKMLQNCYVPGEKQQGIPLALAVSKSVLGDKGAVRVHGGGFAGTIIAFVPQDLLEEYCFAMQDIFTKENVVKVNIRSLGAVKINT